MSDFIPVQTAACSAAPASTTRRLSLSIFLLFQHILARKVHHRVVGSVIGRVLRRGISRFIRRLISKLVLSVGFFVGLLVGLFVGVLTARLLDKWAPRQGPSCEVYPDVLSVKEFIINRLPSKSINCTQHNKPLSAKKDNIITYGYKSHLL